ncbi:MAG: M1 family metallopeptidase [Fluviicola sp.]|nr:M1 family metallopeptidase [Fluviicola sp.]
MKFFFSLAVLFLAAFSSNAQSYWQQKVEYTIAVKLDDKNHMIHGQESFVYTNNSPSTLDFIYIHLWPNAYKNGKTALGKQQYNSGEQLLQFGNDSIKGGIDSLNFTVNGAPAKLEYDAENPDIAKLFLNAPLVSGGQINVATPFRVKLPSGEISRLGHVGQSYQITQWYPKPAVYDKNGWNPIPYLNQGEFYSEYGTYDVSITLPKNYVVGATGDLQTQSEIDFLNDLAAKTLQSIDTYGDKANRKNEFPASSSEWKTIRYTQKDVHDFAWFADKRYLVLKGEVELPQSKRKVTTWTMFTPKNAMLWKNSIEYINDGTFYYSKWNGDYPYNQVTAVDGTISAGGGMEYPNVTVIGNSSNAMELEIVIVHEVGHNWFYGILGSNERVHGWMDEGMNTLNELRYIYTKYPNNKQLTDMVRGELFHAEHWSHYDMADLSFKMVAKMGEDQPIETHSADFTSMNYGAIMYMKTGIVFNYLKAYLGDDLFDKCMHAYFEEWKFKHPQPEDMKATLERESGKDLSWLFGDLIQTTKHIDYKLGKVKTTDNTTAITVKSKGQVDGPIEVTGYKNGEKVKTEWVEPGTEKTTLNWDVAVDEVLLDASHRTPDFNQTNDFWHKKGLFGKVEPLKLEFFIGDNESKQSNVFWTPALGGNAYDKFMLGLLVHNYAIPFNRLQYMVAPMYSFGGKRVSGIADMSMTFLPANHLKLSRFGVSVRSFKNDTLARGNDGYYVTAQPYWYAKLGNRKAASPITNTLLVQTMYRLDVLGPSQLELVGAFGKYTFDYKRPDHEINVGLRADFIANPVNGDQMSRGSAELTYRLRYLRNKRERWAELRLFGGTFFGFEMNNSGNALNYTYSLSGASGSQDVFIEDYYFGRQDVEGLWSQQRLDNMGGFRSTSTFGTTSKWLASSNFYIQMPFGPKIFGLFADYGMFENGLSSKVYTAFNAGIGMRLGKVFGLYFPVYMTKEMDAAYGNANYASRIRFTLKLNITNKPLNLSGIL